MRYSTTTLAGRFWSITLLSFFLASSIYLWVPWLRKPLIRENNLLELLTAALFFLVVILGVKRLVKLKGTHNGKMYWIIPIVGLIGVLEETSFGHSFLYYEVPVINGVKIDALHDFLKVFVQGFQAGQISWPLIASATGLTLAFLYTVFRFHLYEYHWYVQLFSTHPCLKFVVLCLGFLGFATLLDLEWGTHHYWIFVEEFFEAAGSLALLFSYLSMKLELAKI